ncbi:MAG: VacJ family lipoprotein [Paracoccaceae bacterium]
MRRIRHLSVILIFAVLSACGTPKSDGEFSDPYEARNREVHEANIAIDRRYVRPISQAYGSIIPKPVQTGVTNFSANLDMPGMVINDLLQLRVGDALWNSSRFLFNSTVGLAGLFDPADSIGMSERATDFGETMHVWGFGEGNYVELPLVGPSTERDTVGMIVDTAMNPTRLVFPNAAQRNFVTMANVAGKLTQRYQYSDFIDSILYESADSYAQLRLLYLQKRRHDLARGKEPKYSDPYEDPYAQ